MRPPRVSWQLAVKAFEALFEALEPGGSEGDRYQRLKAARLAVDELREFVHDDEECEQP